VQLCYFKGSVEEALESPEGLRRYYPHRTSHWLGLEVHDVGAYATTDGPVTLQNNMVLTIEPGLYMPDLGIGIRIEDDVLVRSQDCEVLTGRVPTNPDEIESLVRSGA
jgi:Xaa-Pro aminopeptidase